MKPVVPVPFQKKERTTQRLAHRTDITLPPTVAEAVKKHAEEIEVTSSEYYRLAIAAFFKHSLVNPPEPFWILCPHCGRRRNTPRSSFKRVRVGLRFDAVTVEFLDTLSVDYFNGNWSRAFEEAMRFFLGDARNPPPEGQGRVPGEKQAKSRMTALMRREKQLQRIHDLQQKVKTTAREHKEKKL